MVLKVVHGSRCIFSEAPVIQLLNCIRTHLNLELGPLFGTVLYAIAGQQNQCQLATRTM